MNKNILIIGTYFDDAVDSYSWSSELPNLSDYETIILDPTRIIYNWLHLGRLKPISRNSYIISDRNEQDDKIVSNIRLVKKKLIEMLYFKVDVYAFYSPTLRVDYVAEIGNYASSPGRREAVELFKSNDWCPISLETYSEKGKIIHIKDDSLKQYLKDFKGWEYYFVSDSLKFDDLEQYYPESGKVRGNLQEIATNNVDKPIAVKFYPSFHAWSAKEKRWQGGAHTIGGNLFLLPIIDPHNTKPHIESLLGKIGLYEETPPPAWVNSIEMPDETSLKQDLETTKQKLGVLESEKEKKENSLAKLREYKRLLFETGEPLQNLVQKTFKELGAVIEPSPVSDEFIIIINGRKVLVEVKGNTKSIAKGDLGQLITDMGEYLKVVGEDIDGILVGNAWRLEPLEKRNTHDKPIFSQAVEKIAENRNIGLLSTTEWFKAYCAVLEDPTRKDSILNRIVDSNGVIKF